VFDSTGLYFTKNSSSSSTDGPCVISNNLFIGDDVYLLFYHGGIAEISNNTFSDSSGFSLYIYVGSNTTNYMPEIAATDNIFASLGVEPFGSDTEDGALWTVKWNEYDGEDVEPATWENNILWEVDGDYGIFCEVPLGGEEYTCDTTALSAVIAAGSIETDPLFTYSTTQGSYALDPSSPAVDAGIGDPDVDGSPNDIGAFGGPGGDWYLEVPWLP